MRWRSVVTDRFDHFGLRSSVGIDHSRLPDGHLSCHGMGVVVHRALDDIDRQYARISAMFEKPPDATEILAAKGGVFEATRQADEQAHRLGEKQALDRGQAPRASSPIAIRGLAELQATFEVQGL